MDHYLMILGSLCFQEWTPFGRNQFQLDQSRSLCDRAIPEKSMCFSSVKHIKAISIHFNPNLLPCISPFIKLSCAQFVGDLSGSWMIWSWGNITLPILGDTWLATCCCAGRAETWNTMGHLGLNLQPLYLRVFEQRWFVGDCLTMFNTIYFAFSLLSGSMPSGCCRYCKRRTREYFESFGIQLPRRVMLHLHLGQPSAWMTKLFLFQLGFVVIFSTKLRASWKEVPFEVAETENSCFFLAEDWSKDVHFLSFA